MSNTSNNKISFSNAVAMGINIMVGSAVLAGPGIMAALCGNTSTFGWFLAAAILLPIVYNVSRLPEVIPGVGGISLYCKKGFGRLGGFVGGWTYFVCYNACIATAASAFRIAFAALYPDTFLFTNKLLFFAILFTVLFLLNLLPETTIANIQSSLTYVKVIPIVLPIVMLPFFFNPNSLSFSLAELMQLPQTLPLAIFAFFGFEFCCNLSDKVEGGPAAARSSILTSFGIVTVLYALFHFSVLNIMGLENLIALKASGYGSFLGARFPLIAKALTYILPVTLFITFFNTLYGLLYLDGLILQSLAEEKLLRFSNVFGVKTCNGRPWIAIGIAALFASFVGIVIKNINDLAITCNLALFILFGIVMLALMKVENHKPFSFNRLMSFIGLIVACGLIMFNWTQVPGVAIEKFITIIPLFVGLSLGLLLFNPEKKSYRQ